MPRSHFAGGWRLAHNDYGTEDIGIMATGLLTPKRTKVIPTTMQAAVYRGIGEVRVETVPVPQIGAGDLLLRVHTCGICGTDLKKIATGSHSAPRIFGHETSGMVAAVGADVTRFRPGDRVVVFHHIPCGECFYCQHKTFAQCETYKKVGCTAGFEAAGGGFAEYVRVMDWIVREGTVAIPDGISYEQACFVEPVSGPPSRRSSPTRSCSFSAFSTFGDGDKVINRLKKRLVLLRDSRGADSFPDFQRRDNDEVITLDDLRYWHNGIFFF